MDTGRLLSRLLNEKSITAFLSKYKNVYEKNDTFSDYVNAIIKDRKLIKSQVIKASNIDKTYAYELLRGKRDNPSRNKVIMLAFGLQLDIKDTQVFLKQAGYLPLNPKNKQEIFIIYALSRNIDIITLNIMLDKHEQPILS